MGAIEETPEGDAALAFAFSVFSDADIASASAGLEIQAGRGPEEECRVSPREALQAA